MRRKSRPPARLLALVTGLLAALCCLALVIATMNAARYTPRQALAPAILLPTTPPPPVEPTAYAHMTPEQARDFNAAVPLADAAPRPAPRFRYAGLAADRAAARACLAAAALYEAGDDKPGEQAVIQVVLNRLRHPAFPKTVCGVVFQGSERRTGCQFTFTCDGSLGRTPGLPAWERALGLADAALDGFVDQAVGAATHYHADYVVPYWHGSLEKIAAVHAQIFYRWAGAWGSPRVLTGVARPMEPIDPRVALLAGLASGLLDPGFALDEGGPPRTSLAIPGVPPRALGGSIVRLKDEDGVQFVVQLAPGLPPARYATLGFTLCADRPNCMVMGWTSEAETPRALPVLPGHNRTMAFAYRKSAVLGLVQPFWDCRRFHRALRSQCLAGTG